jgi:hypothetical protein
MTESDRGKKEMLLEETKTSRAIVVGEPFERPRMHLAQGSGNPSLSLAAGKQLPHDTVSRPAPSGAEDSAHLPARSIEHTHAGRKESRSLIRPSFGRNCRRPLTKVGQ